MATFNTQSFIEYDDYMTPLYAWEWIKQYIPNDKVIWEAFYGDGSSGEFLKELGFNVIHEPIDFLKIIKVILLYQIHPFLKKKK